MGQADPIIAVWLKLCVLGNFTAILKQFGFRDDEIRIEPIESMAADRRRYVDRVVAGDASATLVDMPLISMAKTQD